MIRWKLLTGNRVGMVHDVLRVFAEEEIDIVSMEVIPEQIHLKMTELPPMVLEQLRNKISHISGVHEIRNVEVMPSEEREEQLRAILNSISEGIIAINPEGRITAVNPASETIFHRPHGELMGRPIQSVLGPHAPIISCIADGTSYDNREIILDTPRGRSHYLTSGRAIRDDQGSVIGAVAVMKDIAQVRQLIYTLTQPPMITFNDLIFQSKAMEQVVHLAKKTAVSNSTVLIRGESGTGKELFARAIHMASLRRDHPFVPINCGALPDSLLESELFGYEGGSFTGALKGGKQGLFELAQGGTVFLDEIGELPTHLQVKLLRVLQEGKVRRVGGSSEQQVDVRVIAATNKHLEQMIEHKEFREDLYYRLNVIPIHIPPLRQRREDVPVLINHFLQWFSTEVGRSELTIDPEAMRQLLLYDWPGNVRELRNVMERAVHLTGSDCIQWNDFFPAQLEVGENNAGVEVKVHQIIQLEEAVSIAERALLEKVVQACNSSRQMGEMLGVSHTTVLNKLKKHRLL